MREIFNYQCKLCKSTRIVYDEAKGELFCLGCGIVFEDNYEIFSISNYVKLVKEIEAEERKLLMSEC